jgi:hypothetical protein
MLCETTFYKNAQSRRFPCPAGSLHGQDHAGSCGEWMREYMVTPGSNPGLPYGLVTALFLRPYGACFWFLVFGFWFYVLGFLFARTLRV